MDDVKKPLCTTNAFELPQLIGNVAGLAETEISLVCHTLYISPRPELSYEVFKYHLGLRKL